MELHLRQHRFGAIGVLVAEGEIDLATAPQLRAALLRLVTDPNGGVVAVDLDAVGSIDDTGLGVLLGAAGRARTSGRDLVVVCTNQRLRDRLTVTGLDRAISVVASITELA